MAKSGLAAKAMATPSPFLRPTAPEERMRAGASFRAYGETLIAEKRERPDESILSRVIHGFEDQPGLAHEEVINFFSLLWAAGSQAIR